MITSLPCHPTDERIPRLTEDQITHLVDEITSYDAPLEAPSVPAIPAVHHRRRMRPWVIGLGAAAAVAAFTVASTTGVLAPPPAAEAWSAVPSVAVGPAVDDQIEQCRERSRPAPGAVQYSYSVDDGTFSAVPDGVVPDPAPPAAPMVIAEQRGTSTAVLLDDSALCVFFAGAMAGGGAGQPLDPLPAPDEVTVIFAGFAGGMGSAPDANGEIDFDEAYSAVVAEVGTEVTAAMVNRVDGEPVTATVMNGWLLAWWPSTDHPTTLTVTTTDGSEHDVPVTSAY